MSVEECRCCRRRHRRIDRGAGPASARHRRPGLRSIKPAEGNRSRHPDQLQRQPRSFRVGAGDRADAGSGPAGTAGAASLEHRRNLELVRPRRQEHRALRHAASHAAPGRFARSPRQRGPVAEARCHHPRSALRCGQLLRRTRGSDIRGRQRRQGALCDRRRRHPFQGPGLPVRTEPAGVHRLHRMAWIDSDAAPARPSGPNGRDELARPPRQCAALPGASRRADELRQHVGTRRLAGRILVDRGKEGRVEKRFPGLACRRSAHDR